MLKEREELLRGLDLRRVFSAQPVGTSVKIRCTFHRDGEGSMCVYRDHCYCMGCGRFLRQQEGLAYVLGLWDGEQDMLGSALVAVQPYIAVYQSGVLEVEKEKKAAVLDRHAPAVFHQFLLSQPDILQEFMRWRGFTLETIEVHELGWTGSHFSIPVRGLQGELRSIRYRARQGADGGSKYEGEAGHNQTQLFSLPSFRGVSSIERLFVCEGEYDKIAFSQLGAYSVTITNGAGQLTRLPELWQELNIVVDGYVIATDNDEAGDEAAYNLARLLPGCMRADFQGLKDCNDFLLMGGCLEDIELLPM